ncbi:MAG: hypothetical protein F2740_03590, partial [Actinobacteria bacterium]|nr:hypothetical protein [Actinomycetota bacterium]
MDAVVRDPSALAITVGSPPSSTATTELVVPRSMPTARAMSCLRITGSYLGKSPTPLGLFSRLSRGGATSLILTGAGSRLFPGVPKHFVTLWLRREPGSSPYRLTYGRNQRSGRGEAMITRTRRNVAIALAAVLATSGLALASPTAALAVTCPTVDPVTFAVTPAASSDVDWSGCDLTGANLQDAALDGANLDGANLTNANLTDATGPRGTFIGTNFTNANLTSFNGYLADFTGADFT